MASTRWATLWKQTCIFMSDYNHSKPEVCLVSHTVVSPCPWLNCEASWRQDNEKNLTGMTVKGIHRFLHQLNKGYVLSTSSSAQKVTRISFIVDNEGCPRIILVARIETSLCFAWQGERDNIELQATSF